MNKKKPHIHKNSKASLLLAPSYRPTRPSLAAGDLNRNTSDSAKAFPEDGRLIHPLN